MNGKLYIIYHNLVLTPLCICKYGILYMSVNSYTKIQPWWKEFGNSFLLISRMDAIESDLLRKAIL